MTFSRRKTLSLIGGGFILAAGGAGYAITRKPQTALKPWDMAGAYDDPRMRALSHAILAPNPHNQQPWKVDLGTPDEVHLYADTDRLLPHTDPFNRQIVIGLGCFLEVLRLAALSDGLGVDTELFPQGSDETQLDGRPVAVCRFAPTTAAADPLFEQVPHRRSVKEPFDTERPVTQSALNSVLAVAETSIVGGSVAPDDIGFWRDFTHEALRIEIETDRTYKESVDLFRIGRAEIEANPDGIDFSGPLFEAMALTGTFTREGALDRSSTAYSQGLAAVYANTDTAMGHFWQVTDGDSRAAQIAAGRDWVRMHLAATAIGLAVQPLSQALQEYDEMSELYAQVHAKLAPDGGVVQMLARVGYGPEVARSPRWPIDAKVLNV